MKRALPLLLILLIGPPPASAETPARPNGGASSPRVGSQPVYRLEPSRDGALVGAAAAGMAAAAIVGHSQTKLTAADIGRLSRDSVNPFDRGATREFDDAVSDASWAVVGALAASPLALLLDPRTRGDRTAVGLMYAETVALAAVLPAIGKSSVGRIRPLVYNPDVPVERKLELDPKGSFFSRHTTIAFASATFLCTVYDRYHPSSGARPYLWAGSMAAAAGVGWMRYESGRHFPTDIIVGAAVGGALGWGVPALHRASGERVALRPLVEGRLAGLALRLEM